MYTFTCVDNDCRFLYSSEINQTMSNSSLTLFNWCTFKIYDLSIFLKTDLQCTYKGYLQCIAEVRLDYSIFLSNPTLKTKLLEFTKVDVNIPRGYLEYYLFRIA